MYRLHCFCQSGNSYKVALTLRCLKQPWTAVFVDYMNSATKTEAWRRQFNEMGEVPILEGENLSLTQSGMILTYLADKHHEFGGRNPEERREILRWLLFDNHKFSSYFVSYRFIKSFGPTAPNPAVLGWLKSRIDAAFSIADQHLRSRSFILGEEPTIADFSMCGYLFFPEKETGLKTRERFTWIAKWLDRIQGLPGWADPYDILPGARLEPRW
jgi:glutathione S-transferase